MVTCGTENAPLSRRGERAAMVASSAWRFYLTPFAALLAVLMCAASGHATCDPTTDPDKTDIANARAAVAANCDCAGALTHGAYVSCAAQQANTVLVNKSCAGSVKKCASHSTCGKPGAVTCCLTTTKGTKCKIKKDAAHCTAKQGTVGSCTSCCDACPAPGSGPSCPTTSMTTSTTTSSTTPTSTSTSTSITMPMCPTTTTLGIPNCQTNFCGPCLSGQACTADGNGQCGCTGPVLCGGTYSICGGECPTGQMCAQIPVPAGCPSIGCDCQ